MLNCGSGFPCATRTSWTHDNPGRKFIACKFYNHETGQRGCNTFDWVDVDEPTNWQRDVINMLLAEKQRIATDNHILRSRLVCAENEKSRLSKEM
ncbi:1 4-alpha-glucan branching enzyme GlgB [Bienertia sinuspersici]